MKKLLFIAIVLLFSSCMSNLDKKIDLTEYNSNIEKIKAETNEYSKEDFATASKELNKHSFKAMQSGNTNLEMTYKELLATAQEINKKQQQEFDVYNKELQKLKDVVTLELLSGKYEDASAYSPQFPHGYVVDIKATNSTGKTIVALKGKIILLNENNEKLMSYMFEENFALKPNSSMEASDSTLIFEDDSLTELRALSFNKIKQQWHPELIIFEDGSRMVAPQKPYGL